jgi:hypothetical protein
VCYFIAFYSASNTYLESYILDSTDMKLTFRNFFLLITLFSLNSKDGVCQQWPIAGAHWEYCNDFQTRIFDYTKDTIIGNYQYQVIEQTNTGSSNTGPVYTRQSNDTVYRYVQSEDYIFLVFNAQVDDVYTTFRTDFDLFSESTCTTNLPVRVLDLDTLGFGSLNLQQWLLQDTLFTYIYSGSAQASTWRVVERIGFLNDFPFTLNWEFSGNFCSLPSDMGRGYYLTFYSDSSYSYLTPTPCIGNSIHELDEDWNLKIYPNPADESFQVKNGISCVLTIKNILGKILFSSEIADGEIITTAELPNGCYIVEARNSKTTKTNKLIINH